jgi:hypothetical protein
MGRSLRFDRQTSTLRDTAQRTKKKISKKKKFKGVSYISRHIRSIVTLPTFDTMADSTTPKVPETPLVLHHLNNSRSQRILWLLEELNVNYEIKHYKRQPDMMAPKELKEVHSLGKSPVITDGRHTIAESGAIVEYLVSR